MNQSADQTTADTRRRLAAAVLGMAALLAIAIALWQLTAASAGLRIAHMRLGPLPVTLYRPADDTPAPTVVIAHGFAGSQPLMQPYAVTLARNGYRVLTFDFPGHGRNTQPFVSGITDQARRLQVLLDGLAPAVDFALSQPGADGRLALLGHSMAGDVLVRYAERHPGRVGATLLLSPYLSGDAAAAGVGNLLLIYGALEPEMLQRQGLAVLSKAIGQAAQPGVTYGDPARGDARRLVLAPGVEHIGELYSPLAIDAARDWLDRGFSRSGSGFVEQRGPWLGLLYLGLIALAWPLAQWLPRLASAPLGAGLGWRRLLPVALVPAIATPLVLWKLPHHFLPILLGDYLALHFAVYGLITAVLTWWIGRRHRAGQPAVSWSGRGFVLVTLAVSAYAVLAIAVPTDRFVATLLPGTERLPLMAAVLAGTLPYFIADEWLTRGRGAARGGYALTKVLFLASLACAVALDLRSLFFLIIIVPAILPCFLVYGLMSGWVYRRTGHPLVMAVASALAFASAIAATFPLVGT